MATAFSKRQKAIKSEPQFAAQTALDDGMCVDQPTTRGASKPCCATAESIFKALVGPASPSLGVSSSPLFTILDSLWKTATQMSAVKPADASKSKDPDQLMSLYMWPIVAELGSYAQRYPGAPLAGPLQSLLNSPSTHATQQLQHLQAQSPASALHMPSDVIATITAAINTATTATTATTTLSLPGSKAGSDMDVTMAEPSSGNGKNDEGSGRGGTGGDGGGGAAAGSGGRDLASTFTLCCRRVLLHERLPSVVSLHHDFVQSQSGNTLEHCKAWQVVQDLLASNLATLRAHAAKIAPDVCAPHPALEEALAGYEALLTWQVDQLQDLLEEAAGHMQGSVTSLEASIMDKEFVTSFLGVPLIQELQEQMRAEEARAKGKLPDDATVVLRTWFEANIHHPYPSESAKADFMDATGLTMTQINNWFTNMRKRHGPNKKPGQR